MVDHKAPLLTRLLKIPMLVGRAVRQVLRLLLISLATILLYALLLRLFGGVEGWQSWRVDHYWQLLAWRITIYAGLIYAWCKLRTSLRAQGSGTRNRPLRRIEILVVLLVLLIEFSKVGVQPGGLQ